MAVQDAEIEIAINIRKVFIAIVLYERADDACVLAKRKSYHKAKTYVLGARFS
jgi:hypothetical protein